MYCRSTEHLTPRMKNADKPAVAEVLFSMLGQDRAPLNEDMATAVFEKLGIRVSRSEISLLRTELGINSYQLAERSVERQLQQDIEALRVQLRAEGFSDAPNDALMLIVTLRRENAYLSDQAMQLSEDLAQARKRLKTLRERRNDANQGKPDVIPSI